MEASAGGKGVSRIVLPLKAQRTCLLGLPAVFFHLLCFLSHRDISPVSASLLSILSVCLYCLLFMFLRHWGEPRALCVQSSLPLSPPTPCLSLSGHQPYGISLTCRLHPVASAETLFPHQGSFTGAGIWHLCFWRTLFLSLHGSK